jgi:ubiquitin-conjugating enzyme E2 M
MLLTTVIFTLFLLDIAELNLPMTTKISFPNGKDDLMNFEATIKPDEGYYV